MIIIANQKKILSEIFFEILRPSFADFVNEALKTEYIFNYTVVEDLVSIKLNETEISSVMVNYADVRLEKMYEDTDSYDAITLNLIRFIHACVDHKK